MYQTECLIVSVKRGRLVRERRLLTGDDLCLHLVGQLAAKHLQELRNASLVLKDKCAGAERTAARHRTLRLKVLGQVEGVELAVLRVRLGGVAHHVGVHLHAGQVDVRVRAVGRHPT